MTRRSPLDPTLPRGDNRRLWARIDRATVMLGGPTLFFSVLRRDAGAPDYALASTSAVAALAQRRTAIPTALDGGFAQQAAAAGAAWLGQLTRRALLTAGFAAFVLAAALSIPAWMSFAGTSAVTVTTGIRSSADITGTMATTTEDLSASTFVGRVPFVQQQRYYAAVSNVAPPAQRFVLGARQSALAGYVQDVGARVALPYLNDAVATTQAVDAWSAAVAEGERQAAIARVSSGSYAPTAWQAPPAQAGTKLPSTVTFYACVGNGFCGTMASGLAPFEGAAACSGNLAFGTKFIIDSDPSQRVFQCLDRGALAATWVDVWFYDAADGWAWQSLVGTSSTITIVE
jgi:hypothetical protein